MKRPRIDFIPRRGSGSLGTFGGVFTPSVLTILGIILFRRLGYVTGNVGLGQALVIIGLANLISLLTSLSLSGIATNLQVKGGGDYYIISRTLGVEFGGGIGLVLFLAQSVSIAFYCIGFGEAVGALWSGAPPHAERWIALGAISFLFIFAWLGADWATRLQYLIMAALAVALVSFFIGGARHFDPHLLRQSWSRPAGGAPFWVVFALFFPAVTGFTQGVSMSGDLKDPGRSLPRGTFAAVGLSALVYFAATVLFAGTLPPGELSGDYQAMNRVAEWPYLIDMGIIAATLSSAMASFLGAPRILQSLATDRIFPWLQPFAAGAGPANNPRRGALLSLGIALVTVALGNLNVIAPVVSMFFLISYGLLNYATYYEARAASPSFRPRFRWFDRRVSLLGALSCLGAMLAIQPAAALLSGAVLFGVYQYLKRTAGPARWADSSRSYLFQRIRENLLALSAEEEHPRDWRPQILAFSKDAERRLPILEFASWIEGGSGLTTAVHLLEGTAVDAPEREQARENLLKEIQQHQLNVFPLVLSAPDVRTGFELLLQAYGLGPLRANIVLLNWLEQVEEPRADAKSAARTYGVYLRESLRLGRNLVILDASAGEWAALAATPVPERRIDVWWWGGATSRLALLLAYLMRRTADWHDAELRVLTEGRKHPEEMLTRLEQMLEEFRIEARSEVFEHIDLDLMAEQSKDAALVFVPLLFRNNLPVDPFEQPPAELLARLPAVALVLAAEDIHLELKTDEGKQTELADAVQQLKEARKEMQSAEKAFTKGQAQVEKTKTKLEKLEQDPSPAPESLREVRARLAEMQADLDILARALKKAKIGFDVVAKKAEEMGYIPREAEPEDASEKPQDR